MAGQLKPIAQGKAKGRRLPCASPFARCGSDEDPGGGERASTAGESEPADAAAVVSPSALVRLDGLRVLVVDDEADARRVLVMVLEQVGAIVTAASSVREAIEALPEARPDVLVSDLGMPEQDGFDLIRQVRAQGYDARDLPAVALTAFAHKDDARQALVAGFQVHVSKPVDPHDLTSIIASLAGRTG